MAYPCIKQPDQSSCGTAALATIALYYKKALNFEQIRELTGTDKIGTNFSGLKVAAERIGFEAVGVMGPYEELPTITLPAVAHIVSEGLPHFVVIFKITKKGVTIADPASGIKQLTKEAFCKLWTGRLLLITPRADFVEAGQDLARRINPWQRYLKLILPHAAFSIEIFIISLVLVGLSLSSAFFIQYLVDSVLVHGENRLLAILSIGMITLTLFKTCFGLIKQYLIAYVARKIHLSLISDFLTHILHLPMKFFESREVGDVLSRLNDTIKINQLVSTTTITVVLNSVLTVIFLGLMFYYDWALTLAVTAFLPFIMATALAFDPMIRKFSRRGMEQSATLQSYLVENITGIGSIKVLGAEELRNHGSDQRLVQTVQTGFSLQMVGITQQSLQSLLTGLLSITVLWYGGVRVIDGSLTIGQLMFFNSILGSLIDPLNGLTAAQLSIQDGFISLDRLGEIIDLPREALNEANKSDFQPLKTSIELENVCFRYASRGDILTKINLRIPMGKTMAIVGESGSGKSTILKLLMRYYDPTEGTITMDGKDLRDINISSLRSRIGFVPQEPYIFSGTIKQNITISSPSATLDQVIEIARLVDLERFINNLPERYETRIGERGVNLSGGQRQRLALARALLNDPDIIIFDEATSQLDSKTEMAIQRNLGSFLAGKTVLVVAHRLSTIRMADWIYVLDNGVIVESGTHENLLDGAGVYAGYWRSQVGGRDLVESHLDASLSVNGRDTNGSKLSHQKTQKLEPQGLSRSSI